jgi:hypothetical protein
MERWLGYITTANQRKGAMIVPGTCKTTRRLVGSGYEVKAVVRRTSSEDRIRPKADITVRPATLTTAA